MGSLAGIPALDGNAEAHRWSVTPQFYRAALLRARDLAHLATHSSQLLPLFIQV